MKVLEKVVSFLSHGKKSKRLFAVLSPIGNVKDEAKIVSELFDNGLQLYHLRKPRWPKGKIIDLIKQIPEEFRSRVVLHQFPELVEKYKLGGFHILHDDPAVEKFSGELSAQCSCYSDIEKIGNSCRYLMLGPVFPQAGRDITVPARTLAEFAAIVAFWHKKNGRAKILAFGGITLKNIKICKKLGFDGFATVSSVWETETTPLKAFKALNKKW